MSFNHMAQQFQTRYITKGNEIPHTKAFTHMFKAAQGITAKRWRQSKCPSTNEGTNEMWLICTMEGQPAVKCNKVHASRMSLVNTMLTKEARYKGHIFYIHV